MLVATAVTLPTAGAAQDAYDAFMGDWVAAVLISRACEDLTALNREGAADMARAQQGLRKQKVLRLMYYGKTDTLTQLGTAALSRRNVDPSDVARLCQFGRAVAGQNDRIGRFVRVN